MKGHGWGGIGTAVLALLIGCGGGGSAPSQGSAAGGNTTGASTTAIGTTAVVGTTTTGSTAPATAVHPGTYYGSFASSAFAAGGASSTGPSGTATLTVNSDNTFVLSVGSDALTGLFSAEVSAFNGTFTSLLASGGTAESPASGTLTQSGASIVIRFTLYRDASHSSGFRYTARLR